MDGSQVRWPLLMSSPPFLENLLRVLRPEDHLSDPEDLCDPEMVVEARSLTGLQGTETLLMITCTEGALVTVGTYGNAVRYGG